MYSTYFFFHNTPPTVLYTLSLHDALPISQVGAVDGAPDPQRGLAGLPVGQLRVTPEVGARIGEGGAPQRQEPLDVPALHVLTAGIDVDREVEEVRDRHAHPAVTARTGRLQHVQPLQDQHVGPLDHHPLVLDDVVGQMGVHVRLDVCDTGLDFGEETKKAPTVVDLQVALVVNDALIQEFCV